MFNYEITVTRVSTSSNDIYIGRGSTFGNPDPITSTQSRDKACDTYETYFNNQVTHNPNFFNALKELHEIGVKQGYLRLACFCKPLRCHGDTIKRYLDNNRDLFENHV